MICYRTLFLAREDAKRKQDTWFFSFLNFKDPFPLQNTLLWKMRRNLEIWKFNFTLWNGWSESRFPFLCLLDLKLSEIIWFLLKNGMKARRQWSWRARKMRKKRTNYDFLPSWLWMRGNNDELCEAETRIFAIFGGFLRLLGVK